jgi:L-ascorbate metabolism protein UlaG (beta-lactamase superfamily)
MRKKRITKILRINIILLVIIGLAGVFLNQACSSAKYTTEDLKMKKIYNSKNFKDGKFHNFVEWEEPGFFEYIGTMWDFVFKGDQRTPEDSLPKTRVDLTNFLNQKDNHLSATWVGHSSLLINIDGYKILTDPVFEKKVSLLGPTRFNGEVPFNPNDLPDIDVVLISHNHYDHLNKYSIQLIAERTSSFIAPLAVGAQLEEWGIPRSKITELDWWEEINVTKDLMIALTPSQHFSNRGLTDRNETLWASFVVKAINHKIYFSGDSGYFDGFKTIGEKYGPFNMTFIECGAYHEKWHHIHMYPEETVQAHIDLRGEILHPIHWGTFNLSLHPWFEPMKRVKDAADLHGIKLATPVVGGTTVYPDNVNSENWWEELIMNNEIVFNE